MLGKNTTQMSRYAGLAALGVSLAYLLGGVAYSLANATTARGNTAPNGVGYISQAEDYVYNWDFLSDDSVSANNLDWPIRFLFTNNAEIDEIKDRVDGVAYDPEIHPLKGNSGGAMYGRFYDDYVWEWDADSGIKSGSVCQTDQHMRVYADSSDDRNYTTAWGYYVLGSIHEDDEGWYCDDTYESLEEDEDWWFDRIEDNLENATYDWWITGMTSYWSNAGGTAANPVEIGTGAWLHSDGYPVWVHVD